MGGRFLAVGLACLVLTACGSGAAAQQSAAETAAWKRAVLDYTACEGGMTVERATLTSLRAARVQEIGGTRYLSHDAQRAKIGIEYKAANGTNKTVDFGYRLSDGKVAAENDEALAILRMIETGCKS
jgi:hypothetical protein